MHMIPETVKVPHMNGFDSGASEHQIIFRQWRLGFLIFYGAIASLLGGFALVADQGRRSKSSLKEALNKIEKLRDFVAHANDYAAWPEQAREVCAVVRNLMD